MISDKKFLVYIIVITTIILFTIGCFNYIIDYQNYFSKKNINTENFKNISNKINSNNFINSNYSHRDIKRALALFSEKDDCFILGSSQHMLFTSYDLYNLDSQCKENTNLSLPGGSLEDILINSYFISIRENKVKKIFLGIGPYMFKYNSDYQLRWKNFENIFLKMNDKNIYKKKNNISSFLEFIQILFDKKFFIKNINFVKNIFFETKESNTKINFQGLKIHSDGSYIFTGDYELKKGELINEVGIGRWGFDELDFDEEPKNSLINNIRFIKSKGIEVDIILVPFHPIVFSSNDWIVEKIILADLETRKISKKLDLKVHGSFFPGDLKCTKYDFYDDSHPRSTCIKKINK